MPVDVIVEHFYCSNFCGVSVLILQIKIHSFQKSNLNYFYKLFPLLPLCLAERLSSLTRVNLCGFEDLKQVGFGNQSFSWQCHITLRINTSFTYTDRLLETPGFELSAYLKYIFPDFFQVLTQRTGCVPPCSWPAPCLQQSCHTSLGIRQEWASPKPPCRLLCSSVHTQGHWDKTPPHFR